MAIVKDRILPRTLKNIPGNCITWRNMQGSGSNMYDNPGNRYFAIKLDDDMAGELEADGWNVIWRNNNRDEDGPEEMQAYLKVFIKYGVPRYPVDIYLVNANRKSKTLLSEEDLDRLNIDGKPLEFVDVVIRPYYWTYGEQHGIKAQVQAMNILLAQDGLDDDYEIVYDD